MAVAWPVTLPQFKLTGIGDQRKSAKLRSSVDVGPALVRRRYTAAIRNLDIPMTFTNEQRQAFDAFYIDDLAEGSLSFDWTDPVDGATITMRFRTDDGPQFTSVSGGSSKRWDATLQVEVLP